MTSKQPVPIHSAAPPSALTVHPPGQGPRILIVEPDAARRRQVARGLAALGYESDAFAKVEGIPPDARGPWVMALVGSELDPGERSKLDRRLEQVVGAKPEVRSLGLVYETAEPGSAAADAESPASALTAQRLLRAREAMDPWSDESKIRLLRWMAEEGTAAMRPAPCPGAVLGHAYPHIEEHCGLSPGEAVRVLEDLADFGVLSKRLVNRVHLCPNCRRWTVNFRETCSNCSSLDLNIEELIHHFACAYIGLEQEYRRGAELRCPKCHAKLNHIGVDYERPRQTYVCHSCEHLLEDPVITVQCLDCRWEGAAGDVLAWPIYEYGLTERGHEAIHRGELRGLKLREMIHSGRCALASREFFELEVERETYRMERYGRAMSIVLCRLFLDDQPYSLFQEADRETVRAFSNLVAEQVRSLDVAALADARSIAILMPETNESQAKEAIARLSRCLDGFEFKSASGRTVTRRWSSRSWSGPGKQQEEALAWFLQQIELRPGGA